MSVPLQPLVEPEELTVHPVGGVLVVALTLKLSLKMLCARLLHAKQAKILKVRSFFICYLAVIMNVLKDWLPCVDSDYFRV